MKEPFNYNRILNFAFDQIRNIRAPHSIRQEHLSLGQYVINKDNIIHIGGPQKDIYLNIINSATNISTICLKYIIQELFKHYDFLVSEIDINDLKQFNSNIKFSLFENATKTLLIFKDKEDDFSWRYNEHEYQSEDVLFLKEKTLSENVKIIYLLYSNAKKQFIGQSSLNNVLSMYDFFCTYFSKEEFNLFRKHFNTYIEFVNDYLGFTITKNLTPTAQVNFSSVVRHRIEKFDYEKLIELKMHNKELSKQDFEKIRTQYFDKFIYLTIFGKCDFAESFITSEWLYDSMKKAKAIDLTVIGVGYLKSIEQLLYSIIKLHRNEGRRIGKAEIPLIDDNIKNNTIDSTIGSMAMFFKNQDNHDIFRDDIHFRAKRYICEAIFVFQNIRNGYFHKDNIHLWSKIDEIREITYIIVFLLLGSISFDEKQKVELGYPNSNQLNDTYKLCEYINYHSDELFFLCYENGKEILAFSRRDKNIRPISNILFSYSGAYFSPIGTNITNNILQDLPKEIYLANLGINPICNNIEINPQKVIKIFENGKFIGPSIYDEIGTHY